MFCVPPDKCSFAGLWPRIFDFSPRINVQFKVDQVAMTQDLSPSIRVSSDSIIPTMFHIYSPHPTLYNFSNWRHPSTKHYKKLSTPVLSNFLLEKPLWLRKITTDPHILSHVNMECPDDRYPKLKIFISEIIIDSYQHTPVAYVIVPCMILT